MKRFLLWTALIFLLPGCKQSVSWVKKTFQQADGMIISVKDAQNTVRTQEILENILETRDVVNVLPLTDLVVDIHERLIAESSGEHPSVTENRIIELLRANNNRAIFYVRMYGSKDDWSFSLDKNGVTYKADEVKEIDLDHSYELIFGRKLMRFKKNTYKVMFNVAMERPISFTLCNGTSVTKLSWE